MRPTAAVTQKEPLDAVQVRLRCVEAVAWSGVSGAHKDGHVAGILDAAQKLADWVLEGKKKQER